MNWNNILAVYACRLGAIGSAIMAIIEPRLHPNITFALIILSPAFWVLGDLYQKEPK